MRAVVAGTAPALGGPPPWAPPAALLISAAAPRAPGGRVLIGGFISNLASYPSQRPSDFPESEGLGRSLKARPGLLPPLALKRPYSVSDNSPNWIRNGERAALLPVQVSLPLLRVRYATAAGPPSRTPCSRPPLPTPCRAAFPRTSAAIGVQTGQKRRNSEADGVDLGSERLFRRWVKSATWGFAGSLLDETPEDLGISTLLASFAG